MSLIHPIQRPGAVAAIVALWLFSQSPLASCPSKRTDEMSKMGDFTAFGQDRAAA